jgi:hypothetical protein
MEDVSTLVVVKLGQPGGATKGVVRARSAVTVAAIDGGLDDIWACYRYWFEGKLECSVCPRCRDRNELSGRS